MKWYDLTAPVGIYKNAKKGFDILKKHREGDDLSIDDFKPFAPGKDLLQKNKNMSLFGPLSEADSTGAGLLTPNSSSASSGTPYPEYQQKGKPIQKLSGWFQNFGGKLSHFGDNIENASSNIKDTFAMPTIKTDVSVDNKTWGILAIVVFALLLITKKIKLF